MLNRLLQRPAGLLWRCTTRCARLPSGVMHLTYNTWCFSQIFEGRTLEPLCFALVTTVLASTLARLRRSCREIFLTIINNNL